MAQQQEKKEFKRKVVDRYRDMYGTHTTTTTTTQVNGFRTTTTRETRHLLTAPPSAVVGVITRCPNVNNPNVVMKVEYKLNSPNLKRLCRDDSRWSERTRGDMGEYRFHCVLHFHFPPSPCPRSCDRKCCDKIISSKSLYQLQRNILRHLKNYHGIEFP